MGDDDDVRPYASPPCLLHEIDETYGFMPCPAGPAEGLRRSGRLLPQRPLPPYAYLPGRFPHPVRDVGGHSYQAAAGPPQADAADPDAFAWGMDLFNNGYYWEAHEAWEALWQTAARGSAERNLLHGLILLAAAGVKLRDHKLDAARRHSVRAAFYFRQAAGALGDFEKRLGLTAADLAALADTAVARRIATREPLIAFDFDLGAPPRI